MSKEGAMTAALRPALPLLIGIALAGVFALIAMHASLAGAGATDAADTGVAAAHNHGASPVCASSGGVECCSAAANASGMPAITVHAFPGATVSTLAESVPVASLLATKAAERPPSRALLSVIRV